MNRQNLEKAFIGLILLFILIPFGIFRLLLKAYSQVFYPVPTLTASPAEHILRARRILRRRNLSELLYAAVELRFALERMAQRELLLANKSSNRMLKESDPKKKIANTHKLNPESAFAQDIFLLNRATGERVHWGRYRPLDKKRIEEIKGRLGDLLHPKEGLMLGIPNDPWYSQTIEFLNSSLDYLEGLCKDNPAFFSFEGLDHIEFVRAEQ